MKRRKALKHLLQASGGFIAATLLPGCGQASTSSLLFQLTPLDSPEPLPEHLITPLTDFYVQSYALPPELDINQWQLDIEGAVEKPLKLSFKNIAEAPQENFYLTMECIGNPTGGNLIGNAQWTGTPLLPFLEQAGIKPDVAEFVMHGADSYETTLPVAELLRPDVRLVHQMNQAPLTKEHGFPVRIIIPGYFGQKQPKWLVKIEAITKPKRGFWERQGWSNSADIPTHALTRQVQDTRVWNRRNQVTVSKTGERGWEKGILIAGVALDKASPIQQIQISTDDGKTWQQADQNHPSSPHEWTLWRYLWHPNQSGQYNLLARATSQRQVQPLEDRNGKDGSSGVLKVEITLEG